MVWTSIADPITPAHHRVLPHSEPSIAILRQRDVCGTITDVRLVICGPSHHALWYRPKPREELAAVRLRPEWSADIFGISPPDVLADADNRYDLPRTLQLACDRSLAIAQSGQNDPQQLAIALLHDLRKFAQQSAVSTKTEYRALQLIREREGKIPTRALTEHLDISERHLRRRVRDLIGCSPKKFARLLRLTATALAAEREERPNWAQLAAGQGFHDQAHMINEFRTILNITPGKLLEERRALAAFCNS